MNDVTVFCQILQLTVMESVHLPNHTKQQHRATVPSRLLHPLASSADVETRRFGPNCSSTGLLTKCYTCVCGRRPSIFNKHLQ